MDVNCLPLFFITLCLEKAKECHFVIFETGYHNNLQPTPQVDWLTSAPGICHSLQPQCGVTDIYHYVCLVTWMLWT